MPLLGTAVLFSTAIGGELRQRSVQISDDALGGEGVRLDDNNNFQKDNIH